MEEPPEEAPQNEPEPEAEDPDTTPGTWLVTQIASGQTARIPGESLTDIHGKLLRKYPDSTIDDYTYVKQ